MCIKKQSATTHDIICTLDSPYHFPFLRIYIAVASHRVPLCSLCYLILTWNLWEKLLGDLEWYITNFQCNPVLLPFNSSAKPNRSVEVLTRCLEKLMEWLRASQWKLSPDKTELLLVNWISLSWREFIIPLMAHFCTPSLILLFHQFAAWITVSKWLKNGFLLPRKKLDLVKWWH